jgi:LCP family protein required for cell wall assembly
MRDRSSRRPRPPVPGRRAIAAAAALACLGLGLVAAGRVGGLASAFGNPLAEAGRSVDPPAGSIPWKLRHGERVNLLLLGYGGSENDAPDLTDTVMVLSLDPAHRRAMEVSIPRDLEVPVDAWPDRRPVPHKINEAYAIGLDDTSRPGKRPELTGARDRGGRLAEQTVGTITGLRFDGYAGVDFRAFRDVVNAVGGVRVCLDETLDDPEYPDYHDGYVRGGIHFRAGCQQVNGEQALELARSRHASQAAEASDFARARRQQLVLDAVRRQAVSVNAIARAPALMDAMRRDVDTSLGLSDLQALYEWSRGLPDGSVGRAGLSAEDFLGEFYLRRGTCGDYRAYTLCAEDQSYQVLRAYFADLFVDGAVLRERAPVQVVNGSRSLDDLGDRVTRTLQPLGLEVRPPARGRPAERTVVYDYSNGRYPMTARWLAGHFGAAVVVPATGTPPTPDPPAGGLAVVLGHDYALRWIGQGTS